MAAKCYNSLDTNFTCHSFIQVYLWHTCKEKSVEKFKIWHKKVRITLWQNVFWNRLLRLLLNNNKIKDLTIDNEQCNLYPVTLVSVTASNLVATLVCRIEVHAHLLILKINSDLHGFILVCMSINLKEIFPPAHSCWTKLELHKKLPHCVSVRRYFC